MKKTRKKNLKAITTAKGERVKAMVTCINDKQDFDGQVLTPKATWVKFRQLQAGARKAHVREEPELKLHADQDQGPDSDHAKTPRQNEDIMVACLTRTFATLGTHNGAVLNLVLQRPN